jgi:hypothetical protein
VVKIKVESDLDVKKLERCVRGDEILIGYPSGISHPNSDAENSKLAEWLHEGTATIPSRPFLYQGILSQKEMLRREIRAAFRNLILRGETGAQKVAVLAVGAVQEFVRGDYYKTNIPNSPETIRAKSKGKGKSRKVGDRPLIDTGFLINSTTYVLKKMSGIRMGHKRRVRESAST